MHSEIPHTVLVMHLGFLSTVNVRVQAFQTLDSSLRARKISAKLARRGSCVAKPHPPAVLPGRSITDIVELPCQDYGIDDLTWI